MNIFIALNENRKQKAFTLAEVLITLGIIGVVASLTIPTLVKNYQKEQTVTQLKKVYSELSQAFLSSTAENGFPNTWDWGTDYGATNTTRVVQTYLKPYLSVVKDCEMSTTDGCTRITSRYLNNSIFSTASNYMVQLKDGTTLYIKLDGNNPSPPRLLDIFVDINGDKKPNMVGKDIFFISFNKIYPKAVLWGAGKARSTLKTESPWGCHTLDSDPRAGMNCGALIQQDGWQIKDDYPWD